MKCTIALAGNPNSGKTTLFNALTGSNQRVGNWPGVTVDKKEGFLKKRPDVKIQDLPGIYSLSPYTMEEVVSRTYLVKDKPDLIIDVVDASNISRNLYLSSQLLELGIPTVIALNMMDMARKNGDIIDVDKLSKLLGCPVIPVVASTKEGMDDLIKAIDNEQTSKKTPNPFKYSKDFEKVISDIEEVLPENTEKRLKRYYAIKALENDKEIIKSLNLSREQIVRINEIRREIEKKQDDTAEGIVTTERYDAIEELAYDFLKKAPAKETLTDKIDKVVTSRVLGLPIFLAIMWFVYFIAISKVGTPLTDLANEGLESLNASIAAGLTGAGVNQVLVGLICNGALAGMFSVVGFLPQILVLFALLSVLQDIGYMARVAFVMDSFFRRFGLSGKSFIPIMIGTGCSVPGIQASRTIENDRDRRITIMTTSFMPCSAKLPVITLIAGSFFPENKEIITYSLYLIGIAAVAISGIILKKFKSLASKPAPFVMELPAYHAPRLQSVVRDVADKGLSFLRRAGTIIAVSAIILWALGSFDFAFNLVEENGRQSILAGIGSFIAPIFKPLGFGTWQAAVATFTGFVAKENVVNTLGVVLGLGSDVAVGSSQVLQAFNQAIPGAIAGYSFLLFNMLCMPCFTAVGAIKAEMNSTKWTLATVGYQMGFAYAVSFMFYNFAQFFANGIFGVSTVIAILLLLAMLYLMFRKNKYSIEKQVYSNALSRG